MRIISGVHRGRKILVPKKLSMCVRPTTDLSKESIFNILQCRYDFSKIVVLDLFSGTGNMSYEFISRGVPSVTSVDKNIHCVSYISQTFCKLGALGVGTALRSEVMSFLRKAPACYDVIFADPPYGMEDSFFEEMMSVVFGKKLLTDRGTFILEHSKHLDFSGVAHFCESRTYSGSKFSFFGNLKV